MKKAGLGLTALLAALLFVVACDGSPSARDGSGRRLDDGGVTEDGRAALEAGGPHDSASGPWDARAALDLLGDGPRRDGAAPRDGSPGPAPDSRSQPTGDAGALCVGSTPAAVFVQKVTELPDYTQTDSAYGGFANGGNYHCGPTAVSNSLVWLADHGHPGLMAHSSDRKKDQHDLIATLGSATYLATSAQGYGTPPSNLLPGLKRYLQDKGVAYRSLKWQGWSPIPIGAEFDTGVALPSLDWIKLGIQGRNVAWLLIAMGTHDPQTDVHRIANGHWLTVVGHGTTGSTSDPRYLVVHDPWTGGSVTHAYVQTERLGGGTLTVDPQLLPGGLTRSAAGYYRLRGPFSFSQPEVLLLGAVVLELPCTP
ncbi:MAG: hypothetical protein IT371_25945 [Deltaproteobacteria bacterium]|nr:hypothetical protein [Deltaproteobacteria bacterium]